MMAETQDALREKQLSKTIRKARIHASEYENEEGSEPEQVKSQSTVPRKGKAEQKKQRSSRKLRKAKHMLESLKPSLRISSKKTRSVLALPLPRDINETVTQTRVVQTTALWHRQNWRWPRKMPGTGGSATKKSAWRIRGFMKLPNLNKHALMGSSSQCTNYWRK
ncbi:uncharacterized protein LOC115321349 [Ixodes scapularis]|uniref:uncharacterized protein LOC115321349 n=1 Tax=Ixodes scapularis TaxID=6945 RepID=UPI001A9EB66C|nr:uncharacterized protein LOC115321349 [Ixodes scapularis]